MKTTLLKQAWSHTSLLVAGVACLLVACGSGAGKYATDTMVTPDTMEQ